MDILDQHFLGKDHDFLCGDRITLADYVGIEMVTLGELVHCTYQNYPNVRRWIGRMKGLEHWASAHEAVDGFAASLKDRQFVSI
jgi:glutathione S-transferase